MSPTTKIYRLEGKVQHYAWGGNRFIPELLGENNNAGAPYAEYWMGAHDNVPSMVVKPDGTRQPLNEFIQQDPEGILGTSVYKRFGRLPYLFKVLDVKDMLSIQVHPNKKDAELAFAEENQKGIALNAPERNYKDDNHKPELMVALSDFWLLHGFKEPWRLKKVLQDTPELQFLLPVFGEGNYSKLYKTVMTMEQSEVNRHLQPLLDRILPLYERGSLSKKKEDFWAARAALTFNQGKNIDKGIFSIYFFNLLNLEVGQAIFQDANVPHAYLEGQNMEIMANSDNVLRGGLTIKHVDVDELMKHIKFEPVIPHIMKGEPDKAITEAHFKTPAADFELSVLELAKGAVTRLQAATAEVYFIYKGSVSGGGLIFRSGETMLATAGAAIVLEAIENAVVFRASVPASL